MNIRMMLLIVVLSIILIAVPYTCTFGVALSKEHTRWAEFGSFFGGVLGPLFALLSLLYLADQIKLYTKEISEARRNTEINQRENHISTCLSLLEVRLNNFDATIQTTLSKLVLALHQKHEKIENPEEVKLGLSAKGETWVLWVNIASSLTALKTIDNSRYLNQLTLVTIQFGQRLCSALDNVATLATGIQFEHHFNTQPHRH